MSYCDRMGNMSRKSASKCALLTKEEQRYLVATFRIVCQPEETVKDTELIAYGKLDAVSLERFWGSQIDPRFTQYLSNYLFGFGRHKSNSVEFGRFSELYVYNVRGTADERLLVTCTCLGKEFNSDLELPYQLLREYCETVVSTYIKLIKITSTENAVAWLSKGFHGKPTAVQALGEALVSTIAADMDTPQYHCNVQQLLRWFQNNVLLKHMAENIYMNLYGIRKIYPDEENPNPPPPAIPTILPEPEGLKFMPDYPAFIDISHIVWLNCHVPQKYQHKWRFLFSVHIHGESFSTMVGRIVEQGPSLVIVEDHCGYIFGGFASVPWTLGPTFAGNEDSFLFTLKPRMRLYPATTYNNHFQYINHHTRTLPNGLLMGGQFHFGGIWVNADPFGEGSSAESCSTYRGYKRLSKEPNFKIKSLEVWGLGDQPINIKDSDERDVSVLDINPEAKAILDMAGRTRHSEGIREPPPL